MKVYLIILFLSIPSMGKLECSHMTINQIESFSGYKSGLSIIKTMKKEKIKESSNTSFFIIKGLAQRNDLKAFTDALDQHKRYYSEVLVLSLLESLGFSGNHTWAKHASINELILTIFN